MAERVIEPRQKYYAGGTVPKTAGHDGVKDVPMMAAEYAPVEAPKPLTRVYLGGTTTSTKKIDPDANTDDMGRQLIG